MDLLTSIDKLLREYMMIGVACYLFLPLTRTIIHALFSSLMDTFVAYKIKQQQDRDKEGQ